MTLEILARYCSYLENLNPETLASLDDYADHNVRFKDPFNDVTGIEAMRAVFAHMFATFGQVEFSVASKAVDGQRGLISWTFNSQFRGKPLRFEGMSALCFSNDSKLIEHIDYWDAASAFYEKLPLIGWQVRLIRQRIQRLSNPAS